MCAFLKKCADGWAARASADGAGGMSTYERGLSQCCADHSYV